MLICEPIENELVMMASLTPSEWLLALTNSSSAFSITTDSPNVTSSVVRMLRSSAAWITVRCST